MRGLVVERQRDRVEHVLPVAILPLPRLAAVDPELRVPADERLRHLGLPGPAVIEHGPAHRLGGVHGEREVVGMRDPPQQPAQRREFRRGKLGMGGNRLEDEYVRSMGAEPHIGNFADSLEPVPHRDVPEGQDTVVKETETLKDGVAEFPGTGIEGQDGVRSLGHGV